MPQMYMADVRSNPSEVYDVHGEGRIVVPSHGLGASAPKTPTVNTKPTSVSIQDSKTSSTTSKPGVVQPLVASSPSDTLAPNPWADIVSSVIQAGGQVGTAFIQSQQAQTMQQGSGLPSSVVPGAYPPAYVTTPVRPSWMLPALIGGAAVLGAVWILRG